MFLNGGENQQNQQQASVSKLFESGFEMRLKMLCGCTNMNNVR